MNERGPKLLAQWRASQTTDSGEPLSQFAAAEMIGASQTSWHDWEHGIKVPHLEQALKLAELTDGAVPVESWLGVKPHGASRDPRSTGTHPLVKTARPKRTKGAA